MALSQFGGRPGSGSGSGSAGAGKEVGELVLVPSSFTSTDFAEAGQTVSSATLPALYSTLKPNATGVSNLIPHPTPVTTSASTATYERGVASYIRGSETFLIMLGGRIVKTTDGLTYTEAGSLPLANSVEKSAFGAENNGRQYQNVIAGTIGSTSVAIALGYGRAIAYKTTNGTTWTKFTDAQLDAVAIATSNAKASLTANSVIGNNVWFGNGKAIIVGGAAKKIIASSDGVTWTDVTGTVPTSSFTGASAINCHADSQSLTVCIPPTVYTSVDNGANWKSATIPYVNGTAPNAFTNFMRFRGNLYVGAYNASSVIGFYRTTDLGTSWVYTNGSSVSGTTVSTYQRILLNDNDAIMRLYSFQSNRAYSTTDGSSWNLSTTVTAAPFTPLSMFVLANNRVAGTDGLGKTVVSTDSINSTTAPTLVQGQTLLLKTSNPPIGTIAQHGGIFVGLFESTALTTEIVVGNASTMQIVNLPVADQWVGVCWHSKAQRFYLTGKNTTGAFTSVDGLTWTALTVGTELPGTVANTFPVNGTDYVVFVPRASTNTASVYGIVFDDGVIVYTNGKSNYTGSTSNRYSTVISNGSDRALWAPSGTTGMMSAPGIEGITGGVVDNTFSLPASSTTNTRIAVDSANSRFVYIAGAVVYVVNYDPVTNAIGTSVSFTLPITPDNHCIIVDGSTYTILSISSLFAYQTTDAGITWAPIPTTGVPRGSVFYCSAVFDGVPVVFTSSGTFIGSEDVAIKVIPQYTAPTPGQKYVVKAK